MTLDAEWVLSEAADWVWTPDDAVQRRTREYHLVAYPDWFSDPTITFRLHSERPADHLVDEVVAAATELGRPTVTFAGVSDATRPADLEQRLRERGAELVEEYAVLAFDLGGRLPRLEPPADVELRRVVDLDTRRDLDRVDVAVFGGHHQTEEQLATSVAALEREADAPRWVAYRGGRPVGAGGLTRAGDLARLWGGGVVAEARHTGVYRALLDHRLRAAFAMGCLVALTKARVHTSAPVLRRCGFAEYGRERSWRLGVPAATRSPHRTPDA